MTTTQLVSAFTTDDFVPCIAIGAEIAVQSRPSENTPIRLLLVALKGSAGTMTENVDIIGPVLSEAACNVAAGAPSELARGFRASRAMSKDVETYLLAVPAGSGTAATASILIGGTWSTPGTLVIWIDGEPVRVEVGAADATTDVATAIVDAWDLEAESAVTVAADSSTNTFTCRDVTTRGNSKILYVDRSAAPSGLTVSLLPPLGELLTIVNELRTDLLAHFALTAGSVHGGADSTSGASFGSAATSYATAIALVNLLRTGYAAHRVLTSGSVHGAADSTNIVLLSAATTAAEAVLLANDLKAKYNAHRILTTASVHGAADTTNVTAATDATDGAVAGDSDTGNGVSFAGGTGTESVALALAKIAADPRHFKRICFSAIDATNLGLIETFSDEQSAAMIQKPSAVVLAHSGTQSAAQAISKTQLNHEGFSVLWARSAETPAFEIACAHMTDRVTVERNSPAGWNQSYSGKVLKGVRLARSVDLRANDHATQKSALKNGLTPLASNDAGETVIVRAASTKCLNGDGSANYGALDVAEFTTVMEVCERSGNIWRFFRSQNPKVRDDFAVGEVVVSGVATPIGLSRYMSQGMADLPGEGVFESPCLVRGTYNRTTKRIQWTLSYTRAALHEQSEGIVQSLA
mgnify:CR=1 FL=1